MPEIDYDILELPFPPPPPPAAVPNREIARNNSNIMLDVIGLCKNFRLSNFVKNSLYFRVNR